MCETGHRRGGHVTSPTVESPMNRHRPGQWGQSAFASSFGSSLGGPASLLTSQSCVGVIVVRRTHRPRSAPRFSATTVARFRDSPIPRFFGSSTTTSSVEKRRQPGADFPQMPLLLEISPLPSPIPMLPFPYRCSRARALVSPTFVGGLVLSPE